MGKWIDTQPINLQERDGLSDSHQFSIYLKMSSESKREMMEPILLRLQQQLIICLSRMMEPLILVFHSRMMDAIILVIVRMRMMVARPRHRTIQLRILVRNQIICKRLILVIQFMILKINLD